MGCVLKSFAVFYSFAVLVRVCAMFVPAFGRGAADGGADRLNTAPRSPLSPAHELRGQCRRWVELASQWPIRLFCIIEWLRLPVNGCAIDLYINLNSSTFCVHDHRPDAEIVQSHKLGRVASLIGVEGGHSIGTSLGVLRMFYQLGVRYLTITHTCNTLWADCCLVDEPGRVPHIGGLSHFGTVTITPFIHS